MKLRNSLLIFLLMAAAAAAQPLATIPYEIHHGLIFADFQVNGQTLNLAIDSGSTRFQLDIEVAKKLGINIDKVALSSGPHTQAGAVQVRIAEGVVFEYGKVRFTPQVTVVYPFDFLTKRVEHQVNGIVGSDLFRNYVVQFDYDKQAVLLFDPATFHPPAGAKSIALDVTGNNLLMPGKIVASEGTQPIEGKFELDTGVSGVDAVIWKPCSEQPAVAAHARITRDIVATSFGGDRAEKEARIDKLIIGDLVIDNPLVRLSSAYVSGDRPSPNCANVGMDFLKRFHITIDIPHERLLVP